MFLLSLENEDVNVATPQTKSSLEAVALSIFMKDKKRHVLA